MIKKIKSFLQNDLVERCYKTFFQTFIGMFLTIQMCNIENFDNFKKFISACIVAGVCAVWNIIKNVIDNELEKRK